MSTWHRVGNALIILGTLCAVMSIAGYFWFSDRMTKRRMFFGVYVSALEHYQDQHGTFPESIAQLE